jgi:hypothetical protein
MLAIVAVDGPPRHQDPGVLAFRPLQSEFALRVPAIRRQRNQHPFINDILLAPANLALREGHLLAGSDLHREGFQDQ